MNWKRKSQKNEEVKRSNEKKKNFFSRKLEPVPTKKGNCSVGIDNYDTQKRPPKAIIYHIHLRLFIIFM